tara:strand:- start:74 stop:583 length:510 start_codon:yes stop_codon:yes gene_type:complete
MENLIRERISINMDVMDMLNQQIQAEQLASATYLAMASWCDQNGFINATKYFYAQSEEEREHMMKLFTFVNDNGGAAISPQVLEELPTEFSSLKEVYTSALHLEISTTEKVYGLFNKARTVGDYASEIFLQWFVTEQMEEEKSVRDILDIFELMEGMPLKMVDERLPKE